ncbi:SAM and SH3 domain-containing protein 1-like, partial [Pollicipes pollicipes]|uniref:SAM and SH3 domain-containing protein 1-like n=1 Tax=Pollicipes pollicipes TaxID=41117 RepID=UPI0018856E5B
PDDVGAPSPGSEPALIDSNRSSLLSNMSSSSEDSDGGYRGPTVGLARARVDYVPSPYDREALRFSRGDTIHVISMNPSGLWRGALHGRVGTFKFINVEVLPAEERARQSAAPPLQGRPSSVPHLLEQLGVPEYAHIFSLHGFDRVEDFYSLEAEQLSDLGIVDPEHRSSLLGAARALSADPDAGSPLSLCDFTQPLLSELIRDSGCYDVWRLTEETAALKASSPAAAERQPAGREPADGDDDADGEGDPLDPTAELDGPRSSAEPAAEPTADTGADVVHARPAAVRASPPRLDTSPVVDFERKFQNARSVFEPNCVRRQIPVGVRSRTHFSSREPITVEDEVAV